VFAVAWTELTRTSREEILESREEILAPQVVELGSVANCPEMAEEFINVAI
jgi:hypothetical protein